MRAANTPVASPALPSTAPASAARSDNSAPCGTSSRNPSAGATPPRFPTARPHGSSAIDDSRSATPQCFRCEKPRPVVVALEVLRHAVLKPIQLHRKQRRRAIKVQKVFSLGMLAAEFETCEASGLQRAPQLLFLVGLVAKEPAGDDGGTHAGSLLGSGAGRQPRASSPLPSPPFGMEEREKTPGVRDCVGRLGRFTLTAAPQCPAARQCRAAAKPQQRCFATHTACTCKPWAEAPGYRHTVAPRRPRRRSHDAPNI